MKDYPLWETMATLERLILCLEVVQSVTSSFGNSTDAATALAAGVASEMNFSVVIEIP